MFVCKGTVHNNVVILEEGAHLPDGTQVEVRLCEPRSSREEAFARVLAHRLHRFIGIDEIIEEDKKERDERVDRWLP